MKCPVPNCKQVISDEMVMCRFHWFKVPKEVRGEVWREYRRLPGSPEHLAAIMEAYNSVFPRS